MFLIFVIPGALDLHVRKDGGGYPARLGDFAAFSVMFLIGVFVCYHFEQAGNPILGEPRHPEQRRPRANPAATWKAKETRFGIANSRSVRHGDHGRQLRRSEFSMHDSFTPMGGLVPMFNIMTGEVIFGGVGAGLYGILLYCILAVFIAGLMVGRTPEYLGKKIEQKEVKDGDAGGDRHGLQHSGVQRAHRRDQLPGQRLLEPARRL